MRYRTTVVQQVGQQSDGLLISHYYYRSKHVQIGGDA